MNSNGCISLKLTISFGRGSQRFVEKWYSQQMADRLLVSSIASRIVQFSDFLC
jgi:hypothetical protein